MNLERWSDKVQITVDRDLAAELAKMKDIGDSYSDVIRRVMKQRDKAIVNEIELWTDKKPKEAGEA